MNSTFKENYTSLFIFVLVALFVVIILFILSYILSIRSSNFEKLSAYECGFSPFNDSRKTFDVSFYIVSILFIIFDLELALIWPWAENISSPGLFGCLVVYFFLWILTVGFIFEWKQGALNWSIVNAS